jgi:hypothetical protein
MHWWVHSWMGYWKVGPGWRKWVTWRGEGHGIEEYPLPLASYCFSLCFLAAIRWAALLLSYVLHHHGIIATEPANPGLKLRKPPGKINLSSFSLSQIFCHSNRKWLIYLQCPRSPAFYSQLPKCSDPSGKRAEVTDNCFTCLLQPSMVGQERGLCGSDWLAMAHK